MKKYLLTVSLLLLSSCGPMFLDGTNEEPKELTNEKTYRLNFQNSNMEASFAWIKGPFGDPSKESSFKIRLFDLSGTPRDLKEDQKFWIKVIMPSMGGHGPADDGKTQKISKGLYLHKGLYFNMEGPWEIFIILCKKNQARCNENNQLDVSSLTFDIN